MNPYHGPCFDCGAEGSCHHREPEVTQATLYALWKARQRLAEPVHTVRKPVGIEENVKIRR